MEQTMTRKTSRFSRLKVGIAAVAIGALLVVPSAGADTEDVTFNIEGGGFTMGLSNGLMDDVADYSLGMSTTGSVAVDVSDLRGEDGNWTVSLQASDFAQAGEGETPSTPASGLSVSSNGDVTGGGTGTVTPETPEDLSEASLLGTGSGAHGDHSWTPALALDIADGTPAGTYTSTLTVTTSADVP